MLTSHTPPPSDADQSDTFSGDRGEGPECWGSGGGVAAFSSPGEWGLPGSHRGCNWRGADRRGRWRWACSLMLVPFQHRPLSQPVGVSSLQSRKSLLPKRDAGEQMGMSEAPHSVRPGDGGHIGGKGRSSYFVHSAEFKRRKVPSFRTDP